MTLDPTARAFALQEQLADLNCRCCHWADMSQQQLEELAEEQEYLEKQLEAALAEDAAFSQQWGF